MSTNRERYIDELSNKELGALLSNKCYIGPDGKIKIERINGKIGMDSMEIYIWLSQEAKEDKDSSLTKEKIKTDGSLDFIIEEIQRIHNRLYKLEKNVKDLDFDDSEYCHMSHELIKRVEKLEKNSLVGRDKILTELKPQNDIILKQKIDNIITQIEDLKSYILMNKEKDVNDIISQLNSLKLFYSNESRIINKGV